MQGIAIRIARAVNQAMSRKHGKVFADRYHEHVLSSPSEVRAALHYLVHNFRKHMAETGRTLPIDFIDEHSSAIHLTGREKSPLEDARTWLLKVGWSLAGPIQIGRIRLDGSPVGSRRSSAPAWLPFASCDPARGGHRLAPLTIQLSVVR